jgi:hypothetical protein
MTKLGIIVGQLREYTGQFKQVDLQGPGRRFKTGSVYFSSPLVTCQNVNSDDSCEGTELFEFISTVDIMRVGIS